MAINAATTIQWHVMFASKDLLWKHLNRADRDALRCTCRDTRDALDGLVETAVLEAPMRFRGLAWNEDPDTHLAHRARYHCRLPLLRALRIVWNPLVFQSPAIVEVFQYYHFVGGERCRNIKVCDIIAPQPTSPTTMAMHFDLALALSMLVSSAEEIKIDCDIDSFACVSIFATTCASLRRIEFARPLCLFQLPLDHTTLKLTRLVLKERLSGSILRRLSHRTPGLEHLTLTTTGTLDIGRLSFAAAPIPPLGLPALHTLVLVDMPVSLSVADWLAASLPALQAGPVVGQITGPCLRRRYSERGIKLIPKLVQVAAPGSCSYAAHDASLHELVDLPAPILSAVQQGGVMNARPIGLIRISALARHEIPVGLATDALCQGLLKDLGCFGLNIEFVFHDRTGDEALVCASALSKIVAKIARHTSAAQVMLHGYLEAAAQGGPDVLTWLSETVVEICMQGVPFKFC